MVLYMVLHSVPCHCLSSLCTYCSTNVEPDCNGCGLNGATVPRDRPTKCIYEEYDPQDVKISGSPRLSCFRGIIPKAVSCRTLPPHYTPRDQHSRGLLVATGQARRLYTTRTTRTGPFLIPDLGVSPIPFTLFLRIHNYQASYHVESTLYSLPSLPAGV